LTVKELKQHHLKHEFEVVWTQSLEGSSKETVIVPLIVASKGKSDAYSVNTNPYHDDYVGMQVSPLTYLESVVDKIRIGMTYSIPSAGQEVGIQAVAAQIGMIALSFDDIDKSDAVSGEDLKDLVGLQMHLSGDYCEPKWNGTNVSEADFYTNAKDDFGLTTDHRLEGSTFNYENYRSARRESTLKGMLKKVVPNGLKDFTVFKDRPFKTKGNGVWMDVPSNVKRQNQNTILALMVRLPQDNARQFYSSGDTTGVNHLRVGCSVYFNEKNNAFVRT
jgi:hypothetical protein